MTTDIDQEEIEREMAQDLQVDKNHLDVEWENYPDLFDKWGRKLADAIFDRDVAKDKHDLVKAELDADIRQSPAEFGIDRVTEGAIQSAILLELRYKKVRRKYNKAVRAVNRLTTGLRAISSKKAALENEVRLYLGNYFSDPVSGDENFDQAIIDRATEATRPKRLRKKRKK